MQATEKKQLTLAGVLFALAILFFILFSSPEGEALEFFYDESEKKLFTAPTGSIPPIKGINDDQLDGVRAIVIAPKGQRDDESAHRIAYLEKWSPQLKQHMEAASKAKAAGHTVPNIVDRSQRKFHQFIRRADSPQWYTMNTDEAAKIMATLRTKDEQGKIPDICTPNR
jgi:ABC-type glycerol-3-phosphate transport system substrate-binding protein